MVIPLHSMLWGKYLRQARGLTPRSVGKVSPIAQWRRLSPFRGITPQLIEIQSLCLAFHILFIYILGFVCLEYGVCLRVTCEGGAIEEGIPDRLGASPSRQRTPSPSPPVTSCLRGVCVCMRPTIFLHTIHSHTHSFAHLCRTFIHRRVAGK